MTLYELVANKQFQNKHVLSKLIEHHTGVGYKEIILHYDDTLEPAIAEKISSDYFLYEKDKMPLEYIVWHVDFMGNSFLIDKRAMIPRPETEYMIEAVVEGIEAGNDEVVDVLDLGCGCGVLGLSVSLLSRKKPKTLASWDLSSEAVDLTTQNIKKYSELLSASNIATSTLVSRGLEELANFPELHKQRQTNKLVIVCNYPYIPDETFEDNADEWAKTWEPRMAFLGGPDGLDLYRVLFGEIEDYGLTGATLYLEMMTWQMESLQKEFADMIDLQIIKTFHFNIIIVKAEWKKK